MMSTLEDLAWSLLLGGVMVGAVRVIFDIVNVRRQLKKEREDWRLFKASLQPNSLWIEKDTELPVNPFHSRAKRMVVIIEIRPDQFDDLWIKYKDFENGQERICVIFDFNKQFEPFNKNSDQL